MATHDYVIANGTGAAVRSDLNGALAAIVSNNSSATEPATMYAYQWWPDTTTGLLKQRNSANSAWITIGTLASANLGLLSLAGGTMTGVLAVTAGTAALPGIAFDSNTGIYSPGADQVAIATGGTNRACIDASGRLLVGATAASGPGLTIANEGKLAVQYTDTNDTRTMYAWQSDNAGTDTTAVYVESTGKIYARTTTVQAISSERRLKENIALIDATTAWETIKSVPFYSYNFIGADPSNVLYGPMADEVPDEMRVPTAQSDDVGVINTYDNGLLQARLYVALQAALIKIETLETRLTAAGIAAGLP